MTHSRSGQLLMASVLCLCGLGSVMLVSTGVAPSAGGFFDVKKQFFWLGLGALLCGGLALTDYRRLEKAAPYIYLFACLLLLCCFVPGIGRKINGAARWIGSASPGSPLRFQPSEMARLGILIALAAWYSKSGRDSIKIKQGFLIPGLILMVPVLLTAAEVDLGAATLMSLAAGCLMLAGGANLGLAVGLAGSGLAALFCAIQFIQNRRDRWEAWLDMHQNPLAHLADEGMQQVRAMMAFASGGWSGAGLGQGVQKLQGLPYAHTDFIFPMIGEELGLWATLLVVVCYATLLVCGTVISLKAPDRFGKLLGFGVTILLVAQAMINIGVTTACLPNKGMPLPFVSYGGSNLLSCLMAIGLLLSIYRQGVKVGAPAASPIVNRPRVTPRV